MIAYVLRRLREPGDGSVCGYPMREKREKGRSLGALVERLRRRWECGGARSAGWASSAVIAARGARRERWRPNGEEGREEGEEENGAAVVIEGRRERANDEMRRQRST